MHKFPFFKSASEPNLTSYELIEREHRASRRRDVPSPELKTSDDDYSDDIFVMEDIPERRQDIPKKKLMLSVTTGAGVPLDKSTLPYERALHRANDFVHRLQCGVFNPSARIVIDAAQAGFLNEDDVNGDETFSSFSGESAALNSDSASSSTSTPKR